ncbi:hypothetical protein BP422_10305 [Brevibacillus formosus]|uniref:Uncharacterized protein n=1 Tax=Brevibacillus formosus TaxID=54913 RepID=A0A220MGH0_9BACL|nr:hypothetical protein BP422_10305 [Brevibacillus formosus]
MLKLIEFFTCILLIGNILNGVTDLMDETLLNLLRKALEVINARNENILDSTVFQFIEYDHIGSFVDDSSVLFYLKWISYRRSNPREGVSTRA